MSDIALDDATEGMVNIHGSVLEPAEPVTTEFESESQTQEPAPATSAERPAGLEPSEDYIAGVRDAARAAGIQPEPGESGYAEYAQAETQRLREETVQALQALDAHVRAGGPEAMEYATELLEGLYAAQEQAAYEAQAAAEEAEYEREALLDRGVTALHETVEGTAREVGVDSDMVDPQRVAEIAADVRAEVERRYGQEVADALAEEIVQRTVASEADENEAHLSELYEKAEKVSAALGDTAAPAEVVDLASTLYQRELYRAGGDSNEAAREALLAAAKVAGGFSEKSQPTNASVAALYASLNRAIPRTPTPQPEYKVQVRDARGRFTTSTTPVAAKYAAAPPKSAADIRADQQKAAIKQAFAALGGNVMDGWRNSK